jgi:hypothetical protein
MKKTINEWVIVSALVVILSMLWAYNAHATTYKFVELDQLSNHAEEYNAEDIQIKGRVVQIDSYTGRYGGEYIGIVLEHGITVYAYPVELTNRVSVGDMILVDGRFHVFSLYGGATHDNYIATHHIEKIE